MNKRKDRFIFYGIAGLMAAGSTVCAERFLYNRGEVHRIESENPDVHKIRGLEESLIWNSDVCRSELRQNSDKAIERKYETIKKIEEYKKLSEGLRDKNAIEDLEDMGFKEVMYFFGSISLGIVGAGYFLFIRSLYGEKVKSQKLNVKE